MTRLLRTVQAVTATSVVEVDVRDDGLTLLARRPWVEVRDHLADEHAPEHVEAVQFLLDSRLVAASPEFADYARTCFAPGGDLLDGLLALASRIHEDFAYRPGVDVVALPG